jgi:hypothetical protein
MKKKLIDSRGYWEKLAVMELSRPEGVRRSIIVDFARRLINAHVNKSQHNKNPMKSNERLSWSIANES